MSMLPVRREAQFTIGMDGGPDQCRLLQSPERLDRTGASRGSPPQRGLPRTGSRHRLLDQIIIPAHSPSRYIRRASMDVTRTSVLERRISTVTQVDPSHTLPLTVSLQRNAWAPGPARWLKRLVRKVTDVWSFHSALSWRPDAQPCRPVSLEAPRTQGDRRLELPFSYVVAA